jgi:hypothetical protein
MLYRKEAYKPGMLLHGGPVAFSTERRAPAPVEQDAAAEALAAYRASSARMAADRERLEQVGRYLPEIRRLMKAARERQRDFWVVERCSRSRRGA